VNGLTFSPADVEAAARQCFGEPNRRLSGGPKLRFGRRGSRVVDLVCGVFFDHEAGVGGGVLDMLVHAGHARTRGEAAQLLPNLGELQLQQPFQERQERARREEAALAHRRAAAATLWAQAAPLAGSLAELYLREARAIGAPLDAAALRFLADAPYWPRDRMCHERMPAVVARVCDATGHGIGVHLTYLRGDGLAKASVAPSRKCVGTVGGGFIWLRPGSVLVVGEGVETSFSAWEAVAGEISNAGCIAAVSAGGVKGLRWPDDCARLLIAPDRDASGDGERAALALASRADAAGVPVDFIWPPEPFKDWNEVAQFERARQ
jgi:Toprim domain